MHIHRLGRQVSVLSDQLPVPGIGVLPVNAFVLYAAEPVVVDTGLSLPGGGFMDALGSVVDPADVRWIWLTHPDRDHTGALFELLEAAPQARLVTTFLGAGIMSTEWPVPLDRGLPAQPRPIPGGGRPEANRLPAAAVRQSRHGGLLRRPLTNLLQLRLLRRAHAQQ